ncbi:MAG: pyridoxamine 5'-phosphate oxidase family protein [Rhodospirillales bacterium]|nr:pyridoxamine 5'-phosphate oxidase family protein [Rhodospirillales bacterium]
MQARAGMAGRMAEVGTRVIRTAMPDQHRSFFMQLPFILAGHQDSDGNVWASLLSGTPGFVASPDPKTLAISACPLPRDPLAASLVAGLPMGILGVELPTRRRNRANGYVLTTGPENFTVSVEESFGNCPKYIARRDYMAPRSAAITCEPLTGLDEAARRFISSATTFFVASSAGPCTLPDVSHRGGPPGFIGLSPDGTLTIPDYAGNLFFNTLGNILLYPRAGILFPDFISGDMLQLSGSAWVVENETAPLPPGAERIWQFRMTQGQWLREILPLCFTAGEDSPFWPVISKEALDVTSQ